MLTYDFIIHVINTITIHPQVILNNMSVEQIAYNVSARHPAGVRALVLLPPRLLGKAFDGLADADRTLVSLQKIMIVYSIDRMLRKEYTKGVL